MSENRVVALRQPGEFDDPLTEVLRQGARDLLAQAVEAACRIRRPTDDDDPGHAGIATFGRR
jgi:hypothetical protein